MECDCGLAVCRFVQNSRITAKNECRLQLVGRVNCIPPEKLGKLPVELDTLQRWERRSENPNVLADQPDSPRYSSRWLSPLHGDP